MRASTTVSTKRKARSKKEIHISGAEGLYEAADIQRVVQGYIERALDHPKGKADKIIITVEDIKQKPKEISTLPLATIRCQSPSEGKKIARKVLQSLGVSKRAVDIAFKSIKKGDMRGAAIITEEKGDRLEPDKKRGIRVSRLGINKSASKSLSLSLSHQGINTATVKEALILASKVIACKNIIAELCISDDPYYTTGYIASKKFGYLRIPKIKHKRSKTGGRAFFTKERVNVEEMIYYLERMPVIIRKIASCKGLTKIDEILNRPH